MKKTYLLFINVFLFLSSNFVYAQWVDTGRLDGFNVGNILIDDTTLYVATDFGHVYKSFDAGNHWADFSYGLKDYKSISGLVKSGGILYVSTSEKGMFRSADNGLLWEEMNKGLDNIHVISLASDDTMVAAGTYGGGVYISIKNSDWVPVNSGFSEYGDSIIIVLLFTDNRIIAASAYKVFVADKNSIKWEPVTIGPENTVIYGFSKFTNVEGVENLLAFSSLGKIYISSDNGTYWTEKNNSIEHGTIFDITSLGNKLFAAASTGIYYLPDFNSEWINISENIPIGGIDRIFYSIKIYKDYILAGNILSVWKRPVFEITGIEKLHTENNHMSFVLEQNFPNPFNPVTTIKFILPKSNLVTIKLYDILGKEIALLLNEYKTEGVHQIELNASNLTSGIYMYTMLAGNHSLTKKLILLK